MDLSCLALPCVQSFHHAALHCFCCCLLFILSMRCSKLATDHRHALGCRPALNIDVLRVIGVCETPGQLRDATQAVGRRFRGCGRVKVSTALRVARGGAFHVQRTLCSLLCAVFVLRGRTTSGCRTQRSCSTCARC